MGKEGKRKGNERRAVMTLRDRDANISQCVDLRPVRTQFMLGVITPFVEAIMSLAFATHDAAQDLRIAQAQGGKRNATPSVSKRASCSKSGIIGENMWLGNMQWVVAVCVAGT